MDDKDIIVEGQVQETPTTTESPEVVDETSSPADADKEIAEWATNKGYSDEDFANEKTAKALKMAFNAEKLAGKQGTKQESVSSDDDIDIDKLLDEILGSGQSKETQHTVQPEGDLDFSKMSPEEQRIIQMLDRRAEEKARAMFAPIEREAQARRYKNELSDLQKEFGNDVIKFAPQILRKVSEGSKLRDATVVTLMETKLKQSTQAGIAKGKEIKSQEIKQQVEEVKKANTSFSMKDYDKLSAAEQKSILNEMMRKSA